MEALMCWASCMKITQLENIGLLLPPLSFQSLSYNTASTYPFFLLSHSSGGNTGTGTNLQGARKCCISRAVVFMAGTALCGTNATDLENFTLLVDR